MRIDYHDKRLREIFSKLSIELKKVIEDYNRIKPSEKKFLELCLEIAEIVADPIAYYNVVWTIGFIIKVLEFREHERYVISILSKSFRHILDALREIMDLEPSSRVEKMRSISCTLKNIFLHVAYFPELLRDSRFLDKLPMQSMGVEDRLGELLEWLRSDRSYGRLPDMIRERYEEGYDVDINLFNRKINDALSREELMKIYDELCRLSFRKNYPYIEPDNLDEIFSLAYRYFDTEKEVCEKVFRDKILGGFLGRCAGCMLGKPVEGWGRKEIIYRLIKIGEYPLENYFPEKFFTENELETRVAVSYTHLTLPTTERV